MSKLKEMVSKAVENHSDFEESHLEEYVSKYLESHPNLAIDDIVLIFQDVISKDVNSPDGYTRQTICFASEKNEPQT